MKTPPVYEMGSNDPIVLKFSPQRIDFESMCLVIKGDTPLESTVYTKDSNGNLTKIGCVQKIEISGGVEDLTWDVKLHMI